MATVAQLNVNLSATTTAFTAGLKKAQTGLAGFQASVKRSIGSINGILGALGIGFAGFKAFGFIKDSLDAFGEAEQAGAKLDAVLKSTGHAAGLTSEEIKNMASQLQRVSIFGDDATIAAAGLLATFTNVKGNVFKDALAAAQDMASFFGGDLNTSVRQVGKTLQDPIRGIAALRRANVTFTAEQEAQIQGFVEAGQAIKAQEAILAALSERFGGQATAAAETYAGKVSQLAEAFGDLKESIGGLLAPSVTSGLDSIKNFVEGLSGQQSETVGKAVELQAEKIPFLSQQELSGQIDRNRKEQQDTINRIIALRNRIKARGVGESEGTIGALLNIGDAKAIEQLRTDLKILEAEGGTLQSRLQDLRRIQTSTFGDPLFRAASRAEPAFQKLGDAIVDAFGEGAKALDKLDSGFQQLESNARDHIEAFQSANEIIESTKSPLEDFEEQIAKIDNLMGKGFLTKSQAARGALGATKSVLESLNMPDFNARPTAAAFGSQAAFEAITQRTGPQNKSNELLTKILEAIKDDNTTSDSLLRQLDQIERRITTFLERTDPKKPKL